MAVRPKISLHLTVRLDTTNMNTISHWGFSAFPQAPVWERVVNCACMIMHTCNHVSTGQKSSEPHMTFVDASHRPMSVDRSMKVLMLSSSAMKEKRTR